MQTTTRNLPQCINCHIRASALFGSLNTQTLDKVRDLRTCQHILDTGEHLYHEGDPPSNAYTLYEGWVVLYRHTSAGERQILRFALPGEFLGYKVGPQALFDHSAKALTPLRLCTFPIHKIHNFAANSVELVMAIQCMNDALMERCHSSITTIATKSAEAKIAFLLLTLFSRYKGVDNSSQNSIPFPLTQEDIADALGLTSIHVNRILQGLRSKGLIVCKNRCLKILNQNELIRVAQLEAVEVDRFALAG